MNTELKLRKIAVRRKHVRLTESARPEEVSKLYPRCSIAFYQEL